MLKRFKLGKSKEILFFLLVTVFVFLYCFYPHVHLLKDNTYMSKAISFFNNSKNFSYQEEQKGFRIKGGNPYDLYIDRSLRGQETVSFRFTNTDVVAVVIRSGREILFHSTGEKTNTFTLTPALLKTLRVGNREVSHLGIETTTNDPNGFLRLEIE